MSWPSPTFPELSSTDSTTSTTALKISPRNDDITDYGRDKQTSELDSLISKRDQIQQSKKLANTKPDDDSPKVQEMSGEEIQAMFNKDGSKKSEKGSGSGGGSKGAGSEVEGSDAVGESSSNTTTTSAALDVNDLFSKDYIPEFNISHVNHVNHHFTPHDTNHPSHHSCSHRKHMKSWIKTTSPLWKPRNPPPSPRPFSKSSWRSANTATTTAERSWHPPSPTRENTLSNQSPFRDAEPRPSCRPRKRVEIVWAFRP